MDSTLLLIGVMAVGFLGAVLCFQMSIRGRLTFMVLLALPQIVVPGLPESASAFQLWVVLCALVMVMRDKVELRDPQVLALLAFAGLAVASVIWAPLPLVALTTAVQTISLIVIAMHAAAVSAVDPVGLRPVFRWLSVPIAIQALMLILFRLQPSLEAKYWDSAIARWILGSDKLSGFFGMSPDNVFDPGKSGGLWLNANTASMFLGASACALTYAAIRYRSRWFGAVAALGFVAVAFAGSKTAMILLIVVPAIGWLGPKFARRGGRWFLPAAVLSTLPILWALQSFANLLPRNFISESSLSLGTRGVIWDSARRMFLDSPIFGLGSGGWGLNFSQYSGNALGRVFPPHNTLVAAWADFGVLGTLILVIFMVGVMASHLPMMAQTAPRESAAWGFSLAAFVWIFAHGLGDAVTFYGDLRSMIVPGLLLGVLISARRATREPAWPDRGALVAQ